jgi:hypothetical protein
MRYRIGRQLGSGALGKVVELIDDEGHAWAGKILHHSQDADERARRRFEAEARLLTGIVHPNLIAVHGLVEVDGQTALLMELVTGSDLARLIAASAPLPPERVIFLGRGIAAGLAEAHRAGLVHRDLKPANVLLAADGTPKVADFGLARAASFAASDPDALAVAGTPDYMAPEAIDPLAIDARSDLYALGCILCELATGAPPYSGATAFAVLQAHRSEPLPALESVPDGLRRVIRWLLAKSPTDRAQSATEVETALDNAKTSTALTTLGEVHVTAGRRCATCGASGPAIVAVCFTCGAVQLEPTAGPMTVFVTGPGENAHKLDATLRHRLLGWISKNPALGLDASLLAKEVPRMPFALVTGIDEGAASALVVAMQGIGLEAQAVKGGRFALEAIRTKGWTLAKRVAAIGAGGSFYAFRNSPTMIVVGVAAVLITSAWRGYGHASRPVAKLKTTRTTALLPSALEAALARVANVVPAMAAARHRDSLRGVVERALSLRDALDPVQRAALDPQIAQLVELAALASSRLDQLEAELSPEDLRSGDEARRTSWYVRDRWAAKILQVTAFLDAMRARAVMAKARGVELDEVGGLRAQIEALEELA